jgi:hypothetical protein
MTSSPATTLHDVIVTNDQTRAPWRAGRASIVKGRIVIRITTATNAPPEGVLGADTNTYTIVATDGGHRTRRFAHVKLARGVSVEGKKYVFD